MFLGGHLIAHLPIVHSPVGPQLILAVGIVYILFGWLYGSYTILRSKWFHGSLLLFRQSCVALSTILFFVLAAWLANQPLPFQPILDRSWLVLLLTWQTIYGFFLRRLFHPYLLRLSLPDWQLLARQEEYEEVIRQWRYTPFASLPRRFVDPLVIRHWQHSGSLATKRLNHPDNPASEVSLFAVGSKLLEPFDHCEAITSLKNRGADVLSLEQMAQLHLERLPPTLLPEQWMSYPDLRWSNELSFQRKLKRAADILLATIILLLTFPLILLVSILIYAEDGGPVFYVQQRTGWRNKAFSLYKLRTMRHASAETPTPWTARSDQRITRVGSILRRTRLDEIPQLLNVIRGEMSLIGPRPEQPHLDTQLAEQIPHYYKRYWMPPGLSGWAQVCGPAYPSTYEEIELKLSYDLFYLRHWNLFLDILILAKTLKTLLKVKGR